MKKLRLIFPVVLFLFVCIFCTQVHAADAKTGYVNARELYLRLEADSDGEILGKYKKYDELLILGKRGDWYKVQIDGVEGFMSREYVSVGKAPQQTQSSASRSSKPEIILRDVPEAEPEQQQRTSRTVYITDTGSKYHRSGCRYLSKSKIATSLDSALDRNYSACSVCKP